MKPRQMEKTTYIRPHQQITGIWNANPLMPDVCYWHKADIPPALTNVRYWGESGHGVDAMRCLLLTLRGHSREGATSVSK